MSRPKPNVLLEYTDKKTWNCEQILEADQDKIYAVYYKGLPVNIRNINKATDSIGPKYKRTTFVGNPGHAFNLAEKLNALFKTTDFEVFELLGGVCIKEY